MGEEYRCLRQFADSVEITSKFVPKMGKCEICNYDSVRNPECMSFRQIKVFTFDVKDPKDEIKENEGYLTSKEFLKERGFEILRSGNGTGYVLYRRDNEHFLFKKNGKGRLESLMNFEEQEIIDYIGKPCGFIP